MFPLDDREVSRGACWCKVFISGIDFFTRRELKVDVGLIGDRYADGARDRVWG